MSGPEPGARVIGVGIAGGALAEYMVLPAAAAVAVPGGWAGEQALGPVVSGPAALAAPKPLGGIAAGQTVLIHAAAGGTGQAAVKMAKHHGATVIATASPGKHEVVPALGADHVLVRCPTATHRRRYRAGPESAGKPEIRSHRLPAHPGRVASFVIGHRIRRLLTYGDDSAVA